MQILISIQEKIKNFKVTKYIRNCKNNRFRRSNTKKPVVFMLVFAIIGAATLIYTRATTTDPDWVSMRSIARSQALASTLSSNDTGIQVPITAPADCTEINKVLFKNYSRVLGKAKSWDTNRNTALLTEINNNLSALSVCWGNAANLGWFDNEVNIPTAITDTLLIMESKITNANAYKFALQSYNAANSRIDSTHTATNKTSVARPILSASLILNYHGYTNAGATNPSTMLLKATNAIDSALNLGNSNAFLQDGSFDYHVVASAGAYGEVLLRDVSRMLLVLQGSNQNLTVIYDKLYPKLFDAFEPVMHNGLFMDMVRGRDLTSKYASSNTGVFTESLKRLYGISPQKYKQRLGQWIKQLDPGFSLESVARGGLNTYKHYPEINKTVWHRGSVAYGLSMHSAWKRAFETLNSDNRQGWYLSEGWMQLYDSDTNQYSDNWFATVDRQRLSGTTVLYKPNLQSFKCDPANNVKQTWVGGAGINGRYGDSGIDIDLDLKESCANPYNAGINLKAKKSYFFFDEEIVAVGSGISSTDSSSSVNTTIENRKLSKANDNTLTVATSQNPSGQSILKTLNNNTTSLLNVKWLHLTGEIGSQTGYFFPTATNLQTKRENRTGYWSDIGQSIISRVGSDQKNNNFLTAWMDHGIKPSNKGYTYVLLPNKSSSQIKQYSDTYSISPQFRILSQNESAHAIFHKATVTTAINYWQDKIITITNGTESITSDKKAIVQTQHANGYYVVSAASPYREGPSAGSKINLKINRPNGGFTELNRAGSILCKDSRVDISTTADSINLVINTVAGSGTSEPRGKAWVAVFKLTGGAVNPKIATPTCSDNYTPLPPISINVTTPSNGAIISGSTTLQATVLNDTSNKVSNRQFFDGNTLIQNPTSWDTTKVANGVHTIKAIAKDSAGNTLATSPIINVTVNNITPPKLDANLLPNSALKEDPNTNYFSYKNGVSTTTFTRSSSVGHNDNYSLKITSTNTNGTSLNQRWMSKTDTVQVTPGKKYQAKAWIKTEGVLSTKKAYISVNFWDDKLVYANSYIDAGNITNTTTWAEVDTGRIVAPSNAKYMRIEMKLDGSGAAYFDDLEIKQVVTVSTAIPDPPNNVRTGTITRNSIEVLWDAPADISNLAGYYVRINGYRQSSGDPVIGTKYTITGVSPATTYSNIDVLSAANNPYGTKSGSSNLINATTLK